MEINSILEKIKNQPEVQTQETYLALEIAGGLVKSAFWTVENNLVKVLAFGENKPFSEENDLFGAIDASLSTLSQPGMVKVIFGLEPDWVVENKIVPEKLEILRSLSKDLDLNPVGFVIVPEAVIHHLKSREGIPPTLILVDLESNQVTVTVVRLGKISGSQIVNRSPEIVADLTEGLSRFATEEIFPPRIVIYGNVDNLEEIKQQLLSYSWDQGKLSFLHLPKIELLPFDFDIQSVALAGGREIAKAESLAAPINQVDQVFAKGESVSGGNQEEQNLMGFVKDEDIGQTAPVTPPATSVDQPTPVVKPPRKFSFPKLPSFKLPYFNFHFGLKKWPIFGLIGGLLVILITAAGLAWWYLPKAEITFVIKTQPLEKDFTIRLDPNVTVVQKEKLILPAAVVETISEGTKSQETTGTKLIGDPAKGEANLISCLDSNKTLAAGTIFATGSNLKFTLDENVAIASCSSLADPTVSLVKLTAAAIGVEGNLTAGIEFTVGDYSKSVYVAKNDQAFTGGSSREVQVVAKKNQEKLLADLTEELKSRAVGDLKTKVAGNQQLIEESVTTAVAEKTFSKNIDEESPDLSLSLKLKISGLSYQEDEFNNLIIDQISRAVPAGYEYKPGDSQTSFSLKSVDKNNQAVFAAHFKADLIPNLDLEGIRKNLTGKESTIAENYLSSLSLISSYEFTIRPKWLGTLSGFPKVTQNIRIEIRKN